jgi:chromosomal replication initiator protein
MMRNLKLIAEIQERVAEAFELSRSELMSRSRRRPVAVARQVAMYLCRDLAGGAGGEKRGRSWASFPRIGMAFARDHSSVMHACDVVSRRRVTDVAFARRVEELARKLGEPRPAAVAMEA